MYILNFRPLTKALNISYFMFISIFMVSEVNIVVLKTSG